MRGFLRDLDEEIYIEQPKKFKVPGKENLVCLLTKSLYGLKQAVRKWYKKLCSFITEHDFKKKKKKNDHCLFIKRHTRGNFLILLLYVDDILIVGQDCIKIAKGKI